MVKGQKKLSDEQIAKLKENYVPGESITALGRKYNVNYATIRRSLGEMYQPSKMAIASKSGGDAHKKVEYNGGSYNLRMIRAIGIKQKADRYFESVNVGDNFKMYIRDPETMKRKYILVSGTVTQKTDNLIFVGRESISKMDIIEYISYKEKVKERVAV